MELVAAGVSDERVMVPVVEGACPELVEGARGKGSAGRAAFIFFAPLRGGVVNAVISFTIAAVVAEASAVVSCDA
jgi:hypothetical protein